MDLGVQHVQCSWTKRMFGLFNGAGHYYKPITAVPNIQMGEPYKCSILIILFALRNFAFGDTDVSTYPH